MKELSSLLFNDIIDHKKTKLTLSATDVLAPTTMKNAG